MAESRRSERARGGRWIWLALATAVSVGVTGQAAHAERTDLQVAGGSLAIAPAVNAGDFVKVTLDGTATSTAAVLDPFSVVDARGSGAGWTLTVAASTFREWDGAGYVTEGKALPSGSLSMAAPEVIADGTDSPPPSVSAGPYTIDGATVKVATAAPGSGMGSYAFTHLQPLVLSVPASAFATTYRSEITFTLTSGP